MPGNLGHFRLPYKYKWYRIFLPFLYHPTGACPINPSSINCGMKDVENAKGSTWGGSDEKHRDSESENQIIPAERLSLSRRLLTWGVELRGRSQI